MPSEGGIQNQFSHIVMTGWSLLTLGIDGGTGKPIHYVKVLVIEGGWGTGNNSLMNDERVGMRQWEKE